MTAVETSPNTKSSALSTIEGGQLAISDAEFAVLEQIVQGRTLEEAGADSAFLLRVLKNPTLAIAYKLSREASAYSLEEEAIARLRRAADNPKSLAQGQMTAISRLVEQLRWSAEKRHPNVYSTKAALNLTVPIQINTSLDMGDGGSTSAPGFANIYELKAEVARDADEVPDEQVRAMGGLDRPEAGIVGAATPPAETAEAARPEDTAGGTDRAAEDKDRSLGATQTTNGAGPDAHPEAAAVVARNRRPKKSQKPRSPRGSSDGVAQ